MRLPILPSLLGCCLLFTACSTPSRTAGTGSSVAVMEIRFPKEKKTRRVVIALEEKAAPATADNFRTLIARHYYDGMRFHRVFPGKLVQAGDPKSRRGEVGRSGTGGPGYTMPPEIRLKLTKGSVAAARLPDEINPARLSNGSQFFVCLDSLPQLDGKYTVFGRVIEGMDVLESVSQSPADSNDFPTEKIVIKSIRME
jgi:peptidyl-prolyl cis-trans isomerase B (cyclophilin B)